MLSAWLRHGLHVLVLVLEGMLDSRLACAHVHAKIRVAGESYKNANPPKIAKDYTGKVVGEVAAESIIATIDATSEEGNNLIGFLADKQGPKLLTAFQLFAVAVGAAEDMDDFTFLQKLQDEFHDLIPNHKRDGEDVEKYFRNKFCYC